jgi:hypothetical protein
MFPCSTESRLPSRVSRVGLLPSSSTSCPPAGRERVSSSLPAALWTLHIPLLGDPSRKVAFPVSLVDATNPTVFTSDQALRAALGIHSAAAVYYADPAVVDTLERVRQAGARLMGLDPLAQAQPKIAVLSPALADDARPTS